MTKKEKVLDILINSSNGKNIQAKVLEASNNLQEDSSCVECMTDKDGLMDILGFIPQGLPQNVKQFNLRISSWWNFLNDNDVMDDIYEIHYSVLSLNSVTVFAHGRIMLTNLIFEDYVNDIDKKLAVDAFHWTSFDPEKRGESCRKAYAETVKEFKKWLDGNNGNDEIEEKEEKFKYFRKKLTELTNNYLASESRCASSAIAGPANFNNGRQEKRRGYADAHEKKLYDFPEYFKGKLLKEIERKKKRDLGPYGVLWERSLKSLTYMVECCSSYSAGIERKKYLAFVWTHLREISYDQAIKLVEEIKKIDTGKYKLITPRSHIYDYLERKKKLSELPQKVVLYKDEIMTFIMNRGIDRFQILFDGKPSADIRTALKSNGFRWAWKEKAWQTSLTHNGNQNFLKFVDVLDEKNI